MEFTAIAATGIFVLGYALITLEQKFGTHKSAIALMMGGVLWILAALQLQHHPDEVKELIGHAGSEIFGIVAFLLGAMALIEVLVHYRLFDLIRARLLAFNFDDKKQFLVLALITFFFSGILDNIAITIAMIQIARRFFTGKNLILAGAMIVMAANAGGAWSPIGDVTTILLWLSEKFTAFEVIRYAFLPSFVLFVVSTLLLYRQLDATAFEKREAGDTVDLTRSEKLIVSTALLSFLLPLAMNALALPPYIGILFGLGVTWGMIELAKQRSRDVHQTHMTANLEKLVQSVDIASIKFVMGILLSVSALAALGVLAYFSQLALGDSVDDTKAIIFSGAIGILSSIVDNSSLVAMAIKMLHIDNPEIWSLLAIMAGTGGSIMVIASAAGVVAMGNLKQLTVGAYFKVATIPAIVGLVCAFVVWYLQYTLL
jgi:Na+/H+ antiporter NhaD/arsenite permease-like protein